MGKSSNIRHIVKLRQMMQRWRTRARGSAAEVPAGHVAVCVGSHSRRFVVKASDLNHPAFRNLLIQAEEEYGFCNSGPLSLPCDESLFLQILHQISSSYAFRFPTDESSNSPADERFCRLAGHADALPLLNEKPVW